MGCLFYSVDQLCEHRDRGTLDILVAFYQEELTSINNRCFD